jgi:GntR family transcriptional regulator, transcriptional repressor for pyruvate dehydrogenase complex
VLGDVAPGERLPSVADLASSLGVSRAVVRDATRTLAARGLINVRQGHAMQVTEPSDLAFGEAVVLLLLRSQVTLGDVFSARAVIEIGVGPLAAQRGTAADWDLMEARLHEFEEALNARDWHRVELAHADFHLQILRALHLPALDLLLEPMQQIILVTLPPSPEEPEGWELESHYPILEALRRGDEEAVRRALSEHLRWLDRSETAARNVPLRETVNISALRDRGRTGNTPTPQHIRNTSQS